MATGHCSCWKKMHFLISSSFAQKKQIDLNKAQNGPQRVGNWQAAVIETYHQAHCCGHHSELGTSPYFRTNPRPSPTIPILSHYYRIIILSNLYLRISCNVVYRLVWWYSIVRNFPNFIQCPAFFLGGWYFIVGFFSQKSIFFKKAQSLFYPSFFDESW